jgi:hypothetical protein
MSRLFSFRSKKRVDPSNSPEESIVSHKSPALNVVLGDIQQDRRYEILDLGSAVGQNVDFFGQFSCRLHIEDLYDTLSSFDFLSPEDGFSYQAVFSYLMPYPRKLRFDLILAWDILNYLEREECRQLIVHLGHFCQKGTILFGLISTRRHIPDTPHLFRLGGTEKLVYERRSTVVRDCPRYEKTDLDVLIPGFRVCNSFLLRNGYKEYVFLWQ